ncbi:MAG: MATE family efflux transporter [Galactobacillus timonensis]|uniref:MATE family efflux transporter n=1 Tax=Galactobacillus timonensis TaxID=2041840 RepID=UPI0023F1963D|nr:MATE family efflux transporter [Galactobacillus timonensis]MCI6067385.1 MATE family efflux transporter [Galactobacillus timonensis]
MDSRETTTLMTVGDYRKKILLFSIPLFIGNLFQQLYNTADSLIVGNYLGAEALAAVSSVGSLVNLFTGFFLGFSTGASVIIARRIGANDARRTEAAVHTDTALALFFCVLMTAVGVIFARPMLAAMGTPDNVLPLASRYLTIYFAGISGLILYNFFTGILQAAGDAKHPLYYLIFSSLLNIVLDIVLIRVCGMGVEGAAYATIFAEILTSVLVMRRLMRSDSLVHLDLRRIRFDRSSLRQILNYGFPGALQGCVIDFSNILIQSYINSFGSSAMAGVGAAVKAEGFIFLPITSFALALTTYVSQNMGAKEYERVRKGIRFGTVTAILVVEVLGILYFLFAGPVISIFSSDPQVIFYGVGRSRVTSLYYFLVGFSHIASGILRGLGRPRTPMVVMLVCWCLVRVVILFTLGRAVHVIELVYWIYPFTWALSSLVFYPCIRKTEKEELHA